MPSIRDRVLLLRAALFGGGAYLVGYLLTFAWLGGRTAEMAGTIHATVRYGGESAVTSQPTLAMLLGDGGGAATTWAGWLFYSAHLVPFSVDVADLPASGSATVPNVVLAAEAPLVGALFAVPPLLLAGAGALAARGAPDGAGLLPAATRRGMLVAIGYVPLAVAGALAFVATPAIWRRGAVAPDPLLSVLLMGLLYPVLFGGLGGWLSTRLTASRADGVSGDPDVTSQ